MLSLSFVNDRLCENNRAVMFGTDRMLDALNCDPHAGPEEILKNVRRSVDGFVGDAEPFDDLTMLCIMLTGSRDPHELTKKQ